MTKEVKKEKRPNFFARSQAAFCLIEKGSDYAPVAFSTSPFIGMLLLDRKASAPTQGTIHLSLLFLIAPSWLRFELQI